MSVVTFGVFVAQTVGLALLGLVLLAVLGMLWDGVLRRSRHGFTQSLLLLSMRWLEVVARLRSVSGTPTAPRAPPAGRFGLLQPVPVSTIAYRRRRIGRNELP